MQSSGQSLVVRRWLAKTTCFREPSLGRKLLGGTWENVEKVLNRREHRELPQRSQTPGIARHSAKRMQFPVVWPTPDNYFLLAQTKN